jgi:acetyl-CoA carboxylase biotin carboxyl carrier protein
MNGTKKKGDKGKPLAAGAKGKVDSAGVNQQVLETVRELARIIDEYGLSEVEADPSGHVRVRRELGGGVAAPVAMAAPPPSIALAPTPPLEGAGAAEAGQYITSPFVGTFYSAPSPEAASFVNVGANVRKGQVVCIVEAMKLMNEIESETDGMIAEILVKNGEHVEYGQRLFRIA